MMFFVNPKVINEPISNRSVEAHTNKCDICGKFMTAAEWYTNTTYIDQKIIDRCDRCRRCHTEEG